MPAKIIRKKVPKRPEPEKPDWYGLEKKEDGSFKMIQGGGDRALYAKHKAAYGKRKKKKRSLIAEHFERGK